MNNDLCNLAYMFGISEEPENRELASLYALRIELEDNLDLCNNEIDRLEKEREDKRRPF